MDKEKGDEERTVLVGLRVLGMPPGALNPASLFVPCGSCWELTAIGPELAPLLGNGALVRCLECSSLDGPVHFTEATRRVLSERLGVSEEEAGRLMIQVVAEIRRRRQNKGQP